ncbi:MAG: hypothetical protein GY891_07380 [Bacteroidetes bacterium]|nr:hypothetical protein [Bacteroidota bacterium]
MELENLYDLIDEMINVDMAEDTELGMRVREWYERQNQSTDEEWDELMAEEMDWGDDEWD